jgi:hypothetical protein
MCDGLSTRSTSSKRAVLNVRSSIAYDAHHVGRAGRAREGFRCPDSVNSGHITLSIKAGEVE